MKYIFRRCFCFYLLFFISGCSTHHQVATVQFNKLSPHYVSIQQGTMEYYQFGSGNPIVLIPGYATDVSSWNKDFLAVLAQHHRMIVLYNRNVGGTQIASTSYSSKDLANDTYQLIQKLKLKKPAVIGISMGGMIAQQLAILHPDTLSHLILINTSIAGKQSIRPSPMVEKKLRGLAKNKFGFYISAIDLFFPSKWKMRMAVSLATDRFQPLNYSEIDYNAVMPQQQRLIMQWLDDNDSAEKTKEIRLPVLILNGKADIVIPPVNSVILAHTIPHAKLVRWEEGGHAMIYQYPEEIGNVINNYIAAKEK